MAQEDAGQTRTEAPTPRRREEARRQGQVAYSPDLAAALVLFAGLALLAVTGPVVAEGLRRTLRLDRLALVPWHLGPEQVQGIFGGLFAEGMGLLGVLLGGVVVAAVGAGILQVGLRLTPNLLGADLERLSPARGFAQWWSAQGAMRALILVLKILVLVGVGWWVLRHRSAGLFGPPLGRLASTTTRAWNLVMDLSLALTGTWVVLGLADWAWRRWRLEQTLRMTRRELLDEMKHEEGDPLIRARIRKLQREAAQRRMYRDIPTATVVVTNPTHLAIALRYAPGVSAAPRVVAKGAGLVAQRIREIARRHGVPVVERKPLAQVLYRVVRIGQDIPESLYLVVAEVLAFVYRLRGRL